MSEFLWEKRKNKREVSRFVVKEIIKIISICINMRQLFLYLVLLLRRITLDYFSVFLIHLHNDVSHCELSLAAWINWFVLLDWIFCIDWKIMIVCIARVILVFLIIWIVWMAMIVWIFCIFRNV